jgi:DNA segregation ATPase FtsK/SpoIIIE, S-DNA-T family
MAKNNRHHFLVVFLVGSLGILLALALIPTGTKPNLLGDASHIAFFLYSGFGIYAWALPLVLIRFAVARFQDEPLAKPGLKLLGLVLALFSLCAATHVLFPSYQMFSPSQMREGIEWGGKLGVFLGDHLQSVLTPFGTVVICAMVLVLAMWFLEKEEHLVNVARSGWKGMTRGAEWFGEHGFEAFVLIHEKALKAFFDWRARRGEKQVADRARQKIENERKILEVSDEEVPAPRMSKSSIIVNAPSVKPIQPEKPTKAGPKAKTLFTGEAEPLDLPSPRLRETSEPEEDVVAAAMAEAKGSDPMTLKQKMEAASIEVADDDPSSPRLRGTRDEPEEEAEEEPSKPARVIRQWQLPAVHILKTSDEPKEKVAADFEGVSRTIVETLNNFGVEARVVGVNPGPTVTQYEVQPAAGVKINRIASLADDLALALQCGHLRIVAPLPGKAAVGIEVPNIKGRVVTLKELIAQEEFMASTKKLLVVLGKDISGVSCNASLKEMPHVLIAGSTGSGKSVCVNTLIASLIFKYTPEDLRLVLIDPKRVEMSIYKGLPHLALPVVNDPKEAHFALKWLVREMEERYEMLAHVGARDIDTYNAKMAQKREAGDAAALPMYYIVVLVDELADLMMVAKDQVEDSITRLAQMARAVGIHLTLATQRPSVEVITGIIKANFPSRIAFQVFSKVDSRTILDMNGAEALLGRGDMLYLASGAPKPLRLQGAYVTLEEIERLVDFWKSQGGPQYSADLTVSKSKDVVSEDSEDELYDDAVEIVMRAKQASTSLLQRRLKVGYSRAARLLDDMEMRGVVGPADGNKPRKILVQSPGGSNASFENEEESLDEKLD